MKKIGRKNKKGAILGFVVLMLPALIGMIGLAIDLSQAYFAHARLKGAVDLAITASLAKLSPDVDETYRISDAKNEIVNYLNVNLTNSIPGYAGTALSDPNLSLRVGTYDMTTGIFTEDESDPDAVNAINVDYMLTFNTNFATILMVDNFTARVASTGTKTPSTYAPEGTAFPLCVNEEILNILPFGITATRLYSAGALENLYLTSYDPSVSLKSDIVAVFDYFRNSGGVEPPTVEVGDTVEWHQDSVEQAEIFNDVLFTANFNGLDVVLPVVSLTMGGMMEIKGFIGANIFNAGLGGMGFYVDVTFLPGYIDSNWKGTRVGVTSPTVDNTFHTYLVQSALLVD